MLLLSFLFFFSAPFVSLNFLTFVSLACSSSSLSSYFFFHRLNNPLFFGVSFVFDFFSPDDTSSFLVTFFRLNV